MSSSRSAESAKSWGANFAKECAESSLRRSSIGGTPIKKEQEEKKSPVTTPRRSSATKTSTPRSSAKRQPRGVPAKRHSEGSSTRTAEKVTRTPRSSSKRPSENDPSNSNKKVKSSAPKEAKAAPPARKKSPANVAAPMGLTAADRKVVADYRKLLEANAAVESEGASATAPKSSGSAEKPTRASAVKLTAADRKVVAEYRKSLEASPAAKQESKSASESHPRSHASRRPSASPRSRRTSFNSSSSSHRSRHRSRRASEPGVSSASRPRAAAAVQRTPRYNNKNATGVVAPPPEPPMQADHLLVADDVVEVLPGYDTDGVELVHDQDQDAEPEVIVEVVAKAHHGFWKKTAAAVLLAFVLPLIAIVMTAESSSIHSDHSVAPFVADQPDTPIDFKINWSAVVVAAALATLVAHGW